MRILLLALLVISCATSVIASAAPSIKQGASLFNDSTLSTTGNSCATCHPDGKKLAESKAYDDGMLKEMINFCIRDALQGDMLDADSTELN